jgi:hypothetical protein
MDSQKGTNISSSKQYGVLKNKKHSRKVFINGELHHKIHINVPGDVITTFNYKQDKIVRYPYKAIKQYIKRAYSIGEAAKIINRHPDRIRAYVNSGELPRPQQARELGNWYFMDEDILNLQEFFANVHFGRPRNDGAITPKRNSVTKEEVDARLGRREVLYVQNDDGEFIPVWRTIEF